MTRLSLSIALALAMVAGQQEKGKYPEQAKGPDVGAPAVDFSIRQIKAKPDDKDVTVKLSDFKDKSPVLLIFGSYT